jgi:hypothetical protein
VSQKRPNNHQGLHDVLAGSPLAKPREFTDTDPQMLYAIWQMEFGMDPDRSLQEVEHAVVVYDKFAPRVANRKTGQ